MQVLSAKKRTEFGKRLIGSRKEGLVPAVMYGSGKESRALFVKLSDFLKVWKNAGESTIIGLGVDNEQAHNVLIHDVSVDPVVSRPLHVDFYEVASDKALRVHVHVEFIGEPEAVKSLGGALVRIMHEIEVEAMPQDLPHEITIDVSHLAAFGDKIFIKDIQAPQGVKILGDADAVMAKIDAPRKEEEVAAPEINLENIEVAKKGKKEVEEPSDEEPS